MKYYLYFTFCEYNIQKEDTMKTKFFNKRIAYGLALALTVTNALSLLTPSLKSDSTVSNSFLNSEFSVIADAEEANETIELDGSDITVNSDGSISNFDQTKLTNSTKNILTVKFSPDLKIKKIDASSFGSKFNINNKKIELELPGTIEDIAPSTFENNASLISVVFGDSVDGNVSGVIGEKAFYNTGLRTIKIGNSIKTIGENAFAEIKFPEYNFGTEKFESDDLNISLDINNATSLQSIGRRAFKQNRAKWGYLHLPAASKKIGIIGNLTLPQSLITLGDEAFAFNSIEAVTFPDNIVNIGNAAFRNNIISTVNWGAYNKVNTTTEDTKDIPDNPNDQYALDTREETLYGQGSNENVMGKVIPKRLFFYNVLSHINIPTNVTAIGRQAFSENRLETLEIPASVKSIHSYAFHFQAVYTSETDLSEYNNTLKTIIFGKDENGNYGLEKICNDAFTVIGLTGTLELPTSLNYIGDYAFQTNEITKVDFNGAVPYIGSDAFNVNSIISIVGLNSTGLGIGAFSNNGKTIDNNRKYTLKNINFNYGTDRDLHANFTSLPKNAFSYSALRSINIPSVLTSFNDDLPADRNIQDDFYASFFTGMDWYLDNKLKQKYIEEQTQKDDYFYGRYDGLNMEWFNYDTYVNRVALYRINKDGSYYMENDLTDGKTYVFNPVLLEFDITKDGQNLYDTVSPQSITIERKNNTNINLNNLEAIDHTNFKLGDKVTFTLKNIPEGYELAADGLVSLGNDRYELSLTPDTVAKEVKYDDTEYEVGYKKTVIRLRQKAVNPSTPVVPGNPTPEPTPTPNPTPVAPTPATPATSEQPSVDIADANTPQGNTDTTDVDDDTTPQGNTKITKKVKADKTAEVAVNEDTTPKGTATLPKTGGANENIFIILGTVFIGLAITLKKKFR